MKSSPIPYFERFAIKVTKAAGRPAAFILACFIILLWILTGPLFHFSDTWQLVINTGTTVITFLMVFVIQHAQNKDNVAMQLKLNELIAASSRASNRLVDIEDISAEELETLKNYYIRLSELSKQEKNIHRTHSIDEAENTHQDKISVQDKAKR